MSALPEDREIERFARPKPDDVRRVVSKIISGLGVGEDGQAAPIKYRPRRKLPKALLDDGQLTASTWVRPNRMFMEAPNGHTEQGVRLASKRLSSLEFVGIKIDVSVECLEFVHPAKIVCLAQRSRA